MPDMTKIHKSREYADKIIARIPMDASSESYLRSVILNCWTDAWKECTEKMPTPAPYKEDMGR